MAIEMTPAQAEAHRQSLCEWWARRGNAWDGFQAFDRLMLEALHRAPTPEIDRWMRSAYGCLEGVRELMALATAAAERAARDVTAKQPETDGGKEGER